MTCTKLFFRRPVAQKVRDIGVWFDIMETLGTIFFLMKKHHVKMLTSYTEVALIILYTRNHHDVSITEKKLLCRSLLR